LDCAIVLSSDNLLPVIWYSLHITSPLIVPEHTSSHMQFFAVSNVFIAVLWDASAFSLSFG